MPSGSRPVKLSHFVAEPERIDRSSMMLERDDFSSNRHLAPSFCLSMIFSENRYPLFRIMLVKRRDAVTWRHKSANSGGIDRWNPP